MPQPKRVLFVCIGNTCRSQMAEALARHSASDVIEAASAGLSPFGKIVEPTRQTLLERGVRVDGQFSKGLREVEPDSFHLIVNMTGMPGRALFPGANVVDWDIADPYGEDMLLYRQICDEIEEHLNVLVAELRSGGRRSGGSP
ncbi:MAG: low molecular weight phosphatase family protein [Acidobacteria bacterium]|nr:low molecular weight phosphatase family protein [Acidobacteriota bacterium]MBI3661609.1 low molecular weight phosphatase family protein [Acidobacteriota bacterium]